MKVKELIAMLQKCDPESTVYVEANRDPFATVVQEYKNDNEQFVYIADELDYIDEALIDGTVKIN